MDRIEAKTISFGLLLILVLDTKRVVSFTSPPNCGETSLNAKTRIVGGDDANDNEFPFQVSLQRKSVTGFQHFCGASILDKRWIVSASHCVAVLLPWLPPARAQDIDVVVGSVDRNSGQRYAVEKVIINADFNTEDMASDDISLLKTKEDIKFDRKVGPICLPPKNAEPLSYSALVSGWGMWSEKSMLLETKSDMPVHMQKANITLMPESYCQLYTFFRNIGISQLWKVGKRLCLRSDKSTICRGDSGGPLTQIVNGRAYLIGIASFISTAGLNNMCYKSNPVMYVKASKYIDWISCAINKYNQSDKTYISAEC